MTDDLKHERFENHYRRIFELKRNDELASRTFERKGDGYAVPLVNGMWRMYLNGLEDGGQDDAK